ncbi:CatB-related O-acetyltransferase [Aminobacter aganoensis]|uniref:Virginiamycin A acetyltransferase n=1 Tax=Aminobacter aganoensis TaxID=83264 RepID=A0A7X0F743_9HYPH|nr:MULTISPECIES: CatB-related O-acetyltransferase [Aminobacter]KQU64388.1 chloramphenicol acetyltransferase [Aminobacter sp. DSM 101952]MBB6354205.1 virginiamycin A acetyltransferase [Aminobacter aganoensis]
MLGPNPSIKHPMPMHKRVGFLKALVDAENIEVGDFTYYDDPEGPDLFQTKCVLHHYPFIGDKLIIGKFCAIAEGARFIMNGANHAMSGFSTYPFNIFGHGWDEGFDVATWQQEVRGDTVIGNDVWIGMEAVILPGVHIGHGAIIAAKSVVSRHVPPYAIVAGNPSVAVKKRFDDKTIERLLAIAWWDWPVDKIGRNLNAIRGSDISLLEAAV